MLKKLTNDIFIYGVAGILSKGLTWILLPLYAKLLSVEQFGAFDLILTFGVLANLIISLEISQGVSRYWNNSINEAERNILASTGLWFSVIMYCLFVIISIFFSKHLNAWLLGDEKYINAIRVAFFYISANGIYMVLINQFRWELKSKKYSLISIFHSSVSIIFALVAWLYFDADLILLLIAQTIATSASIFICWWFLRNRYVLRLDLVKLRILLKYTTPLVPASLAVFINLYVNRFFIKYTEGLEGVAHFAIASKIASIVMFFIFALQIALIPLIFKYHEDKKTPNQVAKLFRWFISVAMAGCLILTLFSREIVIIIASSIFFEGVNMIAILAPAILISQMYIFAPGISISQKSLLQLWITVAASIVSVLGNWLLVPVLGLWGASISTLISALVFLSTWIYFSQKYYYVNYRLQSIFILLAFYIVLILFGYWMNNIEISFSSLLTLKIFIIFLFLVSFVVAGTVTMREIKYLTARLQRAITL